MTDGYELMRYMEKRIAELPAGYISKKNINGKERYYLQWRENGKVQSKYIKDTELDVVQEQVEERKRLQTQLKELQQMVADEVPYAIIAQIYNVYGIKDDITMTARLDDVYNLVSIRKK